MAELLLSAKQTSQRLGLSLRSFYRYRDKLVAHGLQKVQAGRRITYREHSIDRLIRNAAETESALYEVEGDTDER